MKILFFTLIPIALCLIAKTIPAYSPAISSLHTNFPTPNSPHPYPCALVFKYKMAGLLKVAALFGFCTALAAVLIAWYLKENFDPESVRGKKVVICGASTGIGEELAYQYAKLGAQLLLVARGEEALKKVVARCGELGAKTVNHFVTDLSSLGVAKRLAAVSILLAIVHTAYVRQS